MIIRNIFFILPFIFTIHSTIPTINFNYDDIYGKDAINIVKNTYALLDNVGLLNPQSDMKKITVKGGKYSDINENILFTNHEKIKTKKKAKTADMNFIKLSIFGLKYWINKHIKIGKTSRFTIDQYNEIADFYRCLRLSLCNAELNYDNGKTKINDELFKNLNTFVIYCCYLATYNLYTTSNYLFTLCKKKDAKYDKDFIKNEIKKHIKQKMQNIISDDEITTIIDSNKFYTHINDFIKGIYDTFSNLEKCEKINADQDESNDKYTITLDTKFYENYATLSLTIEEANIILTNLSNILGESSNSPLKSYLGYLKQVANAYNIYNNLDLDTTENTNNITHLYDYDILGYKLDKNIKDAFKKIGNYYELDANKLNSYINSIGVKINNYICNIINKWKTIDNNSKINDIKMLDNNKTINGYKIPDKLAEDTNTIIKNCVTLFENIKEQNKAVKSIFATDLYKFFKELLPRYYKALLHKKNITLKLNKLGITDEDTLNTFLNNKSKILNETDKTIMQNIINDYYNLHETINELKNINYKGQTEITIVRNIKVNISALLEEYKQDIDYIQNDDNIISANDLQGLINKFNLIINKHNDLEISHMPEGSEDNTGHKSNGEKNKPKVQTSKKSKQKSTEKETNKQTDKNKPIKEKNNENKKPEKDTNKPEDKKKNKKDDVNKPTDENKHTDNEKPIEKPKVNKPNQQQNKKKQCCYTCCKRCRKR